MIAIGAIISTLIIIYNIIFKEEIHILAVAVGIYLPIELSASILIGGLISSTIQNKDRGILIGSGIITGEALMGILIALPIFISRNKDWWPKAISSDFSIILGLIVFCIFINWFYSESKKLK